MTSTPEQLHREALVIDSHNDSIVSHIRRGGLSFTGRAKPELARRGGTVRFLRGPLETEAYAWNGQVDLPQLRAGGIDAAFFAVDVTRAWKNQLAYALDAFGFFLADIEEHPEEIAVARCAAEIERCKAEGRIAAVLVVENSDALEGSLNVLYVLHRLGVRSIGITHNLSTWAACGNEEARCGGGLTRFGVELVREMNRLGMLVDVSHISERGFFDVLETSERPVIASHSCCAALCEHPRNLSDAQLRALAQQGGVVGLTFVPMFIDAGWKEEHWPARPSVAQLLDHVQHAVEVAGIDHVGIGSDFDGGGTVLQNATEYPRITEGLLARGFRPEDVRKILGENTLRVLRAALGG
ncbi:MAG TPA: dipeptidase [Armatimonadota bacterium]|nr:dipeptidase [Armatimonadota bacterium]